jgi:haloalkane dehalogenase
MQVLRTPDSRFENLAGWPFAPHYVDITDAATGQVLRMAYVDHGPRDGSTVLLLHGEPSWSYLYRHMIPALVASGHRVLAPDLIGFGRSDKPADRHDYTYERHVAWLSEWFTHLGLQDVTLFCQDWGGLLGLRLVAAFPERFAGVVVANTGLPIGTAFSEGFGQWLAFSQSTPDLPVGLIVNGGTARELSADEVAAYDAPFPDASYKGGACQFPTLVPITAEHGSVEENKAAWVVLTQFDKPFVTAFSDADPITAGGHAVFQKLVPGAKDQPHVTLSGAHFLQEDCPDDIVAVIEGVTARARG